MKKLILSLMIALSLVTVVNASENTISTTTALTEAQKADVAAYAAKMVADSTATKTDSTGPSKTVTVVKEWAEIGTAIGTGLAASAKELGIAANEFATTPVGKFTVFLIAWHFIGATILHVGFALMWFLTIVPILIWYYRRTGFVRSVTEYEKGAGPGGARKVTLVSPVKMTEGKAAFGGVASAVATIIFVVMLCTL